jgi:hypothetical protein
MAKYLYRSCPRCNGYVGIVLREPERDLPLRAVNGQCVRCRYRLAWIIVRGGRVSRQRSHRTNGQKRTDTIFSRFERIDG